MNFEVNEDGSQRSGLTAEQLGQMSVKSITLREHFASIAMQGLLASDAYAAWAESQIAVLSVERADALLEELAK